MAVKLKVFTFNLRTDAAVDGINRFEYRKGRILETIQKEAPDLIGFQEALDGMRAWLRDTLTDYTVVGCGRNSTYRGESVALAFRKDRFEMIRMDSFWLSATPDVPGTRYGEDQSTCPRITTAVFLKPLDAETPFWFINTHLDHKGSTARLLGAVQLLQYISNGHSPAILTGDFNARPDSPEIKAITGCEACPMTDITATLGGTFHEFGARSPEKMSKIDYIFTNLEADPAESYVLPDEPEDGVYISDHRPVAGFVTVV